MVAPRSDTATTRATIRSRLASETYSPIPSPLLGSIGYKRVSMACIAPGARVVATRANQQARRAGDAMGRSTGRRHMAVLSKIFGSDAPP